MRSLFKLLSAVVFLALFLAACGQSGGTSGTTGTAAPAGEAAATQAPAESGATAAPATGGETAGGAITGEVTLWHAYGAGGAEEKAINKLIESAKATNSGATITVLAVPFDQVFNKFETEAATGGGPDLFIAPNDSLGKHVRAALLQPVDGKIDTSNLLPVAIEGCTVDGQLYCVPESLKAVALFHNTEKVTEVPESTDALLEAVKGGAKLGINQNAYHNYGFFVAFGGQLLDDSGKAIADQGGFADAMKYLSDLKAAGATFYTDGGKMANDFQTGALDMVIDGPWNTGNFQPALGDKLAVAPMPAGPSGPAGPLTGVDGFYINASAKNADGAMALAQFLTSPESMKVYVEEAGHVPASKSVEVADPITKGFADSAANGFPRPQSAEFDNFWTPFGDMVTKVMEGQAEPEAAVKEATDAMNQANSKS
jgi:arabinogalactan oligomer/maltooligosaccharide transport system substrate-binding protein